MKKKVLTIACGCVAGAACLFGLAIGAVGMNEYLKDPNFFKK